MLAGNWEVKSQISDSELIEGFLRPKKEGKAVAIPGLMVELGEELYTREPWLLPQTAHPILNPREFFYFGKRNPKYRGCAEGDEHEGSWALVDGRLPVRSVETNEIIGATVRFRYRFRKKGDTTSMRWSNWFMREYRLFNERKGTASKRQVLCKISENLY